MRKRSLFHYDVDDIAGVTPPAETGEEAAPVVEPAVETPEAEAWVPDRGDWDATQEELAQLRSYILSQQQETFQPQTEEPGLPALDPFADDFGAQLAQLLAHERQETVRAMQESLAPITQSHAHQRDQENEQRAMDVLADLASADGDFDQKLARGLAEAYLGDARARFGPGARAAEHALREAGKAVRALELAAEKRGEEKYRNQLANAGSAGRELGVSGTAIHGIPDAADEVELAMRLMGARA